MTIREAVASQTPVIANIFRVHEGAAKKILSYLIADVVMYLSVGKTMNSAQTLATVDLILKDPETKNLKPDDFKICFENAKKGYYGKNYDRIDGQVIFEWLRAYMAERMDLVENENLKAHSELKSSPTLVAPQVIEMYKEVLNQKLERKTTGSNVKLVKHGDKYIYEIEKLEIEEGKEKEVKFIPREKTPREKFIQECFVEFYDKWMKNPYQSPPKKILPGMLNTEETGKFIQYHGKVVDEVEFTEIRLSEEISNGTLNLEL